MVYSVASSVIAIVLLASGIEAITPYNSGAGNIYKLPVTQVQLVTLLIKCLSNKISFSRMCVLKGVHQTSTFSSTLLLALTRDIPLNDLYCSFKIFHLLVEISSGQKCMFTLPMHTKLVSCLCHKCRTSPDHCKFTRYKQVIISHLADKEQTIYILMQVKRRWSESQATSTIRLSGQSWSQQWLALDGTDADSVGLVSQPVTIYTNRYQHVIV